MDEEDKKALKDIVNKLNKDVKRPPYNNTSGAGYSRDYQNYKKEEIEQQRKTRYEKLCLKMGGVLNLKAGENLRERLAPALKLLGWEISPGMVLSAAVGAGIGVTMIWAFVFILNMLFNSVFGFTFLPPLLLLLGILVPVGAGIYTFYKPVYEAQNKVIRSSGEMILSVLYMVVYMRSTPNLEGAIRFAALNLKGPISQDLKGVLWDVEVGNYNSVSEALHEYTKVWKNYNEDYLQSLQLIEAAMNDPNTKRREEMLQDAIDSILESTQKKMKSYSQSLKMPVMILNALGAMLPVLAMIMLPLITVFMGDVIEEIHLVIMFNILLPVGLYWFMKRVLATRPPTTSTKPVEEAELPPKGSFKLSLFGKQRYVPSWTVGAALFFLISIYGWAGYLAFGHVYPPGNSTEISAAPAIFKNGDALNPMPMLMRSIAITYGIGIGLGVSKLLGNKERKAAEEELQSIERQFPQALFQLGNNIAGGTPIEVALKDAAEDANQLEVSGLFEKASRNIRELGMTFEQSLFNPAHGALRKYPSQMIETVMKAVLESSTKGTKMAAMTMMTISKYLQNIQETQETLNDLLEDTTSTITMLAYMLAPVVSGVAVGMSQTIISAMYQMTKRFGSGIAGAGAPPGGAAGGAAGGFGGFTENLQGAISPEILQFVVGIYLIQLLHILGTFYIKITKGENPTQRDLFIGKLLIVGMTFYALVVVVIGVLFGGLITSISGGFA